MWLYCWAHVVYHQLRMFSENNRVKIRILLLVFTLLILAPLIWILVEPHSERYCRAPLLNLLVATFVFTFCMIAFSLIFLIMEPVPRVVIVVFHVYGVACFVLTLFYTIAVIEADGCNESTEYLYYFSLFVTAISIISSLWFIVLCPFWLANKLSPDSVLHRGYGTGICYSPVRCCPCVWHV